MGVSPPLNPWMWVWLIAGFAAFFGLSAYRYVRRTLRKREAFRKLAHQMGNYFSNSGQVKNSSPSAYSSKDSSSDSDLANSLQNLSNNLQTKNMNRKPPPNKGKGEGLG